MKGELQWADTGGLKIILKVISKDDLTLYKVEKVTDTYKVKSWSPGSTLLMGCERGKVSRLVNWINATPMVKIDIWNEISCLWDDSNFPF